MPSPGGVKLATLGSFSSSSSRVLREFLDRSVLEFWDEFFWDGVVCLGGREEEGAMLKIWGFVVAVGLVVTVVEMMGSEIRLMLERRGVRKREREREREWRQR